MTDAAAAPRAAVGLRSERGPVLLSVMLSTALVALDAMVIATAVPAIVADLGGFSQFPWLFSTYLLAQAVSVPIYGKLADLFGRKPVMLFGVALFLVGSVLCGSAWSMTALIVARVVQGLGAGAVMPMGITIIGDLYSVAERARVQGYVASVWGVSSVIGPAIGGLFSDLLSWRWIFFINLPIGALAVWTLVRGFHERVDRRPAKVDHAGAALLALGFSLVILALLEGGHAWAWTSPLGIAILGVGIAALLAFLAVERRAEEPILPLWVFARPVLVGATVVGVLVGALLIGMTSYLPTFTQEVLGASAIVAGFALAAMTIGWPIAASLAGRVYLRIGFRDTALIGWVFIMGAAVLLLFVGEGTTIWQLAGISLLMGIGLGFVASPTLVAVQSVVGWNRRGVVTGANVFGRSIGSALGVAAFGAVVNGSLARAFADPPAGLAGAVPRSVDDTTAVLRPASGASEPTRDFVRAALSDALHDVFVGVAVVAAVMLVGLLLMPRRTSPLRFADDPPPEAQAPVAASSGDGTTARTTASETALASSVEGPGVSTNTAER